VVGSAGLVLVGAEAWTRLGRPEPEWTRKLVHVGGVVPCLLLPICVDSLWVVVALGATLVVTLALGKKLGLLHCLTGVERRGHGSEYYPLAISLIYLLTLGRFHLYVAALLTLCIADAFAALIGSSYGRLRYQVQGHTKSLEGSLTFFLIAFLATHLPLLLLTDLPRPVCVLSAVLTALLVTGFEAVSLRGTDNLFIPLGVFVVLDRVTPLPSELLALKAGSLLTLQLLIVLVARLSKSLEVGAAIGIALFTYGAWALGSWVWALLPLLGFSLYAGTRLAFPPGPGADAHTQLEVRVVARAHLPALFLLALAYGTEARGLIEGPFVACYALTACIAVWTYISWRRVPPTRLRPLPAAGLGLVLGGLLSLGPWLIEGASPWALLLTAALCAGRTTCSFPWACSSCWIGSPPSPASCSR
jgi:phytol kinase